jgi:NitT/TauT family transport system substrate-binding protein
MWTLEIERLQIALRDNILTDWVMENGVGGIDPARMAHSLEQIGTVYEFQQPVDAARYFTDAFLPTDGSLSMN